MNDIDGHHSVMSFDLMEVISPLKIGLDVKLLLDKIDCASAHTIDFQRPIDKS